MLVPWPARSTRCRRRRRRSRERSRPARQSNGSVTRLSRAIEPQQHADAGHRPPAVDDGVQVGRPDPAEGQPRPSARKSGACILIDASSASAEPTSSQNTELAKKQHDQGGGAVDVLPPRDVRRFRGADLTLDGVAHGSLPSAGRSRGRFRPPSGNPSVIRPTGSSSSKMLVAPAPKLRICPLRTAQTRAATAVSPKTTTEPKMKM